MVEYRRHFVPGGTFFFTVNLKNRKSDALVEYINELRESFRVVRSKRSFEIIAMVVLPDHCHSIWQLPLGDTNYSLRWQQIKSHFTRSVRKQCAQISRNTRGEYDLWQRRYWEHSIRDENDLARHIEYIHYNPVKHQHVERVRDWPYSSFHRYVKNAIVSQDWGADFDTDNSNRFGE